MDQDRGDGRESPEQEREPGLPHAGTPKTREYQTCRADACRRRACPRRGGVVVKEGQGGTTMTRAASAPLVAILASVWLAPALPAAEPPPAKVVPPTAERAVEMYDEERYAEAREALEALDSAGKADGPLLYRLSFCLGLGDDRGAHDATLARAIAALEKETAGGGGLDVGRGGPGDAARDIRRGAIGRDPSEREALSRSFDYMTWIDLHNWMPALLLWTKVRGADAPEGVMLAWPPPWCQRRCRAMEAERKSFAVSYGRLPAD